MLKQMLKPFAKAFTVEHCGSASLTSASTRPVLCRYSPDVFFFFQIPYCCQLQAFLRQRLIEMKSDSDILSANQVRCIRCCIVSFFFLFFVLFYLKKKSACNPKRR